VVNEAGFFHKYNFEPRIIYIDSSPPKIAALSRELWISFYLRS
jgi:hypothetical protein